MPVSTRKRPRLPVSPGGEPSVPKTSLLDLPTELLGLVILYVDCTATWIPHVCRKLRAVWIDVHRKQALARLHHFTDTLGSFGDAVYRPNETVLRTLVTAHLPHIVGRVAAVVLRSELPDPCHGVVYFGRRQHGATRMLARFIATLLLLSTDNDGDFIHAVNMNYANCNAFEDEVVALLALQPGATVTRWRRTLTVTRGRHTNTLRTISAWQETAHPKAKCLFVCNHVGAKCWDSMQDLFRGGVGRENRCITTAFASGSISQNQARVLEVAVHHTVIDHQIQGMPCPPWIDPGAFNAWWL